MKRSVLLFAFAFTLSSCAVQMGGKSKSGSTFLLSATAGTDSDSDTTHMQSGDLVMDRTVVKQNQSRTTKVVTGAVITKSLIGVGGAAVESTTSKLAGVIK